MEIIYTINRSSYPEILKHLNECSSSFIPELSSYVDIEEYSRKILEKSTRIEAYSGDELIAFIAIYLNPLDSFITNFSVIPTFQGKGISEKILGECIKYIVSLGNKSLFLEVKDRNNRAISFYKKNKFKIIKNNKDIYHMELKIKRDY